MQWDSTLKSRLNAGTHLKEAKTEYFKKKIEGTSDTKKIWHIINSVTGQNKSFENSVEKLVSPQGKPIQGPINIANYFNDFFTSIETSQTTNALSTQQSYQPFNFSYVSPDYVQKHFDCLKENKATGFDNIPAKFLKAFSTLIAPPFTHPTLRV